MPSTVEELTSTRVKLTIQITAAELKPHLDKAYQEIAKQIQIPGFRKGHVPAAMIDQRFGKGAVLQEALDEILPEAYGKALEENSIRPMGQPDIDITESGKEQVVFTAEVDTVPDFDLPKLDGIKVSVDPVKATDEEVDSRIATLRERFATNTEVERAAVEGDLVTVNLEGTKDGEQLADATAEGVTFKVGNKAMLEGLDDAVTGLCVDESATFTSTLVGGAHKGTECDIKVTVTKVQEQKLPELDDDFAQLVSEFDTVDEMRADLTQAVQRMSGMEQAATARDKALEEIVAQTKLDLPERALAAEIAARHEDVEHQLSHAQMSLEDYLESVEDGQSAEEFWADIDHRTEVAMRAQLILDKVAVEREIQVNESDLTQYLFRRAQQNGSTPEQEAQMMMQHNMLPEWISEIRRNKALNAMMTDVEATDTDGNVVDMSVLNPVEPQEAAAEDSTEASDEK